MRTRDEGLELPSHYYRPVARRKSPSEAIESLGCRRADTTTRRTGASESAKACVTATNDVSANLTRRQIDLSRNPIVTCRMFPRVFPFLPEIRSDLVPRRIRDRASRHTRLPRPFRTIRFFSPTPRIFYASSLTPMI